MKYKTRALGTWNLVMVILCVLVACLCFLSGVYYALGMGKVSLLFVLPVFFVWPIIKTIISITNRYIIFDGKELTFHIETSKTNILQFPKYYVEKLKLKDIDFYGVFSDIYVKDVVKASRKKGSKEYYDIIVVKEGKIEMPIGTLKLGRPFAFVSNKGDSYAYDDALFAETQLSQLFYEIEKASGKASSGNIEGKSNVSSRKSIATLVFFIIASLIFVVLPVFAPFIECTIMQLPYVFMQFNQIQAAYSFILLFGNASLVLLLYIKNFSTSELLDRNNLIGYIASIAMFLFYGVFVALMVIAVLF